MDARSVARSIGRALIAAAVCVLASGHIVFGIGNFGPGYPVGEGVAAIVAGTSLLVALALAFVRRSLFAALITACLGTMATAAR